MTIPNTGPDTAPVTIPLTNSPGDYVLMDPPDWDAWQAAGMPQALYLNRMTPTLSYVAYSDRKAPGGLSYAARWIMKPGRNERVRFRTRNRLDLRRTNLRLVKRQARTPQADQPTALRGNPNHRQGN